MKTRLYYGSPDSLDFIEVGPGDLIAVDTETYMFIGEIPPDKNLGSVQVRIWSLNTLRIETVWNTYWNTCRLVAQL